MGLLFSIEGWTKDHILKNSGDNIFIFLCSRQVHRRHAQEAGTTDNVCILCAQVHANLQRIEEEKRRGRRVSIGQIINVRLGVSSTGMVKVVGDHTMCQPNPLQPGVENWDYVITEYDESNPNSAKANYFVSEKELIEWEEGLN